MLAGRIEAARGQPEAADTLPAASDSVAPATAPAAELELARLSFPSAGRSRRLTNSNT